MNTEYGHSFSSYVKHSDNKEIICDKSGMAIAMSNAGGADGGSQRCLWVSGERKDET